MTTGEFLDQSRKLSMHPGTALSSSYTNLTKGLKNSIALTPVGKLFSFARVKNQAQVQNQLLAKVHGYAFAVTEDG